MNMHNLQENLTGHAKPKQARTIVNTAVGTPAQLNIASLKHASSKSHLKQAASLGYHHPSGQHPQVPMQQSSLTQKNSVSREPHLVKAAAFPDVERHQQASQSMGKSSSRLTLTLSGKQQKNSGGKMMHSKRQNNTPLSYNSGPQLLMSNS